MHLGNMEALYCYSKRTLRKVASCPQSVLFCINLLFLLLKMNYVFFSFYSKMRVTIFNQNLVKIMYSLVESFLDKNLV